MSGAVEAVSSVERVLSHVATGRDAVRAHSQEVIAFSLPVVGVKDSPAASEVSSQVLLLEVGEAVATPDAGPGVDCVPNPGDFSARSEPWDPVERSAVSVLVPAIVAGLVGPGGLGVLGFSGCVTGLADSGFA